MAMGRVLRSSWQRGRRFTLRVFGAAMLISLAIVGLQVHWQVQAEHSRMELIADEYMNYSQLMLADIEQNAQYAGALVVRQNGQVGDFSEAARNIVQNDTAVQRAALAPQGILQPGYPLNDADGGRRILEDASWGAAARWSRARTVGPRWRWGSGWWMRDAVAAANRPDRVLSVSDMLHTPMLMVTLSLVLATLNALPSTSLRSRSANS